MRAVLAKKAPQKATNFHQTHTGLGLPTDVDLSSSNLDSHAMRSEDKFCLTTFNQLAYDRKISGFFAASMLLDLSEYYISKKKSKD